MHEKSEREYSQLFTLRVWVEDVENGRFEFRCTLKHILTGETYHFRDWQTLIHRLEAEFASNQLNSNPGE